VPFVERVITSILYGYLHSSDNGCTGGSLESSYLSSLKDSLKINFKRI